MTKNSKICNMFPMSLFSLFRALFWALFWALNNGGDPVGGPYGGTAPVSTPRASRVDPPRSMWQYGSGFADLYKTQWKTGPKLGPKIGTTHALTFLQIFSNLGLKRVGSILIG